ncbi:hypothetical protein DIX59_00385 [Streptococcus iniae]|nr:hypothetical protein IUSA1_07050 [Streptococcus iniae IUSA1]KYJ76187.1 hypothetical protein NA30_08905 [Streptococcus iniae]RMI77288.1 hypothetical protein DIX59_00385 [Streptococcus iniae]
MLKKVFYERFSCSKQDTKSVKLKMKIGNLTQKPKFQERFIFFTQSLARVQFSSNTNCTCKISPIKV